jgi:O-antigen/teichoic acid export membrane protein
LFGLSFASIAKFIFQFVLAKTLSTAEVGLYNLSFTIALLGSIVLLFGLDRGIVRFVAHYQGKGDLRREYGSVISSIGIVLVLCAIFLPLYYFGVDYLSKAIFLKPELGPIIRVFVISLPFYILSQLLWGVLQGRKLFKPLIVIAQLAVPSLNLIGLFVVIYLFDDTSLTVSYSYLIVSILSFLLAVYSVNRVYQSHQQDINPIYVFGELYQYVWPIFLSSIVYHTNVYKETLILGRVASNEQVGVFVISQRIATTLIIFFDLIWTIFAPSIANLYAKNNKEKLAFQLKTVTLWVFTLALPFSLILFWEAPAILAFFGPDFVVGTQMLRVLVFSQLIFVVLGPMATVLVMTGRTRLNLFDLVITFIFSLALDIYLIPRYEALGAAIASSLSLVFINLLRLGQVNHILKFHPFRSGFIHPIIAGFGSLLVGSGLRLFITDIRLVNYLFFMTIVYFSSFGIFILILQKFNKRNKKYPGIS